VLLLATGIGEAEVNEPAFVFLHQFHDVGDGLGHLGSLLWGGCKDSVHQTMQVPCQSLGAQTRAARPCIAPIVPLHEAGESPTGDLTRASHAAWPQVHQFGAFLEKHEFGAE
jgi:hypothetical protein